MKFTRRVQVGLLVVLGGCASVAFLHSLNNPPTDPPNVVNDVAKLNRTVVGKVVSPKSAQEIRDAVLEARAKGER